MAGRVLLGTWVLTVAAAVAPVWAKDHPRFVLLYPSLSGQACEHMTWETPINMSKASDKLVWEVLNACFSDQYVVLCSYYDGAWDADLFEKKCQPKPPDAKADMNAPFLISGNGGRIELKCKANKETKDKKALLFVDSHDSTRPCPTPTPPSRAGIKPEDHRIDIEIVP